MRGNGSFDAKMTRRGRGAGGGGKELPEQNRSEMEGRKEGLVACRDALRICITCTRLMRKRHSVSIRVGLPTCKIGGRGAAAVPFLLSGGTEFS